MSFGGWRPHIESALCLSVSDLMRAGVIRADRVRVGTWQWSSDGERLASIQYRSDVGYTVGTLRLTYTTTDARTGEQKSHDYDVRLESQPMRFGGMRWSFRCPYTGRRAMKLYKFIGVDKFSSRTAIRPLPTYRSQRLSGTDANLNRRWQLRQALGDPGDLFEPLNKPKWMRWRTFDRYAQQDEQLEARFNTDFAGLLAEHFARISR